MKELKIKFMERMLGAELTAHLGYEDGESAPPGQSNRHNGTSAKVLKEQDGEWPVAIPRDRDSSFEPELVKKGQTRIDGMDDKIIGHYAAGLTVRDIQAHLVGSLALDPYTVNILVRVFFVAIAAVTVDILWGYSGYLTFGQGAFFGLGAYTLAITFNELGFGPWQAVVAFGGAMILGALIGALVGWLSFYPGSTPLYATIISLVVPIVLVQLIYSGGNFTGASSGVVGYFSFTFMTDTWFRIAGLATLAVAGLAHVLVSSDAGRLLRALRDNEMRCAYLGLNTSQLRIVVLVACAAVAAAAGAGYAAFGGIAAPENAGFVFGTQIVVMVALGGRGMLIGAIVGALSIELASAYLSSMLPFMWELLVGIAFVAVIVTMPSGLFGLLGVAARRWVPWAFPTPEPVTLRTAAGQSEAVPGGTDDVVLEASGVTKNFGALTVLSGVSLTARRGELVSLVGPNGAGKTTLIRCLADGHEASAGAIRIGGTSTDKLPPHRVVRLGLGRKFQAASVLETLTVADCLRIARARRDKPSLLTTSSELALPAAARSVVESAGLDTRLEDEARHLSHGLKQAMVLALEPEPVLLDEPTAGLTRAERQRFADILTDVVERERLCVLLVEHDLDFGRQISSRIVVLHQGELALDGSVEEVVNSQLVREIYSGRKVEDASEETQSLLHSNSTASPVVNSRVSARNRSQSIWRTLRVVAAVITVPCQRYQRIVPAGRSKSSGNPEKPFDCRRPCTAFTMCLTRIEICHRPFDEPAMNLEPGPPPAVVEPIHDDDARVASDLTMGGNIDFDLYTLLPATIRRTTKGEV